MTNTNTPSEGGSSPNASPTSPLAAQQVKFVNSVLPIALEKLLNLAEKSFRLSPDAEKRLIDSADSRLKKTSEDFLEELSDFCKDVRAAQVVWHRQLGQDLAAEIRESTAAKAQIHKGWQRAAVTMVSLLLAGTVVCMSVHAYRLNRQEKIVKLEATMEELRLRLSRTEAELLSYRSEYQKLTLQRQPDGSVWARYSGNLKNLNEPYPGPTSVEICPPPWGQEPR